MSKRPRSPRLREDPKGHEDLQYNSRIPGLQLQANLAFKFVPMYTLSLIGPELVFAQSKLWSMRY